MADSQRIQPLGSPPSGAVRGTIYVDASLGLGWYDGTDWHYPIDSGGGGGAVDTVTAEDTSVVVDNTDPANPTIHTGTLDVIATDRPPAAAWSNNSKKITSVADPASAQDAATKHYVDTTTLPSTETLHGIAAANANDGDVALNSHKLTGVTDPASAQDAATKHYVDAETTRAEAEEATLLPLAGGTMSGAIAMGAHKITGLANGSSAQDAAAFGQLPTSAELVPGSGVLGEMLYTDGSGNPVLSVPPVDALQPGFLGGVNPITATINSSTGVLTFSNWPTAAFGWWLTSGGMMVRGQVGTAPTGLTVAGVTSGDFAYLAVYTTAPTTPDGAVGTSLTVGTSRTTAALAAADGIGASAVSGKTLVWDGIAHLASGVWTLVAGTAASGFSIPAATGRDRRPWATGIDTGATGVVTTSYSTAAWAAISATVLTFRAELSGAPVRFFTSFERLDTSIAGDGYLSIMLNGATPPANSHMKNVTSNAMQAAERNEFGIAPGSYVVQAAWFAAGGTIQSEPNVDAILTCKEFVAGLTAGANNGTA